MHAPALVVAAPLVAGAAAAVLRYDAIGGGFALAAACAALACLVAATAALLDQDLAGATIAVAVGGFAAGLSLGSVAATRAYSPPLLTWFETAAPTAPVQLEGVLREDAAATPFGVSLTLDVTCIEAIARTSAALGGARLSVGGTMDDVDPRAWRAGRTVRVTALVRLPSVYVNPGVPDERRALARRGIVLVGSVKSAALVEIVALGGGVSEAAGQVRDWTRRRITAHLAPLDPKSAGVSTAVLIGDRTGLAAEDERRLQEAGTYHVIAISGGNIAILAVLLIWVGRLMLVPAAPAALLTAVTLLFYWIVAAGAASVGRAVTVAVIVLAARTVDHRGAPANALALAAAAAVGMAPLAVLDAGFVLSFGATLGILVGMPLVARRGVAASYIAARVPGASFVAPRLLAARRIARRVVQAAGALLSATVCAELALAPIGATLFGRVTFAGLLLNFAAIPLMTLVQIAGLVVVFAVPPIEPAATAAATVGHLAAVGLLQSARLVDAAPWLAVDVTPPAAWLLVVYYAAALALLTKRLRRIGIIALPASATMMLAGPPVAARDAVPPAQGLVRVTVLDVGQGDATIIELPGRRAVLVDAGGLVAFGSASASAATAPAFDIGERVVCPALRALRVERLHALVVTHGDPDHLQGAEGVLRHLQVQTIWEGVPVPPHSALRRLAAAARARAISWRTVQAGDAERFSHPPRPRSVALDGVDHDHLGDDDVVRRDKHDKYDKHDEHDEVEVRVLHPPPPDWERQKVRNEDSVVLEVRVGRVSIVLPGDIGQEGERAILGRLERGRLVVLKAPHHGSATSSTPALLEALRPAAVIFSAGRDNRFGHPHPAVVERHRAIGSAIFSTAEQGAISIDSDGLQVIVRGWRGTTAIFNAPGSR